MTNVEKIANIMNEFSMEVITAWNWMIQMSKSLRL
jgi:hypothetical protein